jgi:pimeloyl-ACP methyl ester carboxylesterase
VVLVDGFGGDKNSWLFVQQPLAEERTVHALDLPGHGASGKDVGDGSLATLTDKVVGFLDALGVERAHLVGHSLGGAVVVAVAKAAPGEGGIADAARPGRPRWGLDHLDARVRQYRVERGRELSSAVADEEPEPGDVFAEVHDQVAGLLGDPGPSGCAVTPRTCR